MRKAKSKNKHKHTLLKYFGPRKPEQEYRNIIAQSIAVRKWFLLCLWCVQNVHAYFEVMRNRSQFQFLYQ